MRILLSGVPAFGHLLPFAPLARAALAAGHDVALLTSGGMAPPLAADLPGVQVLPAGPMPDVLFAEVGRRTGVADAAADPQPEAVAEFFVGVRVDLTADEAVAVARDWAPDLMICEATDFVGPLVASTLGVPWHVLALGPAVPPEFTAPMVALAAERYAGRGLASTPPSSYIDPVPAALQTPGFTSPARHLLVRAEAHQRPGSSTAAEPGTRGRRRVLVTLGTVFTDPDLLATIVGSLDDADVDVVATLGVTGLAAPDTPGVDYRPFAPLAELLDVDVVLCAGGSGTVLGALSRGIPLVVLPQGADQPLNAARTEAAGSAVVVHDPREAGAATRRVLEDPSFAAAARDLAAEIARTPTPADVIATLVGERASTSASIPQG
ncbi:glycosyltransferase [Modestobacter sp. VKM Ac-2978]|uniref:glycosyltransferase n=1 Tax=Modestobacter sp. VKM Ac-2978 TaxID=3004132 RepID=UPI0022AB4DB1|nr:glycosyltransferase [Modestobacter sp. VKM Ac-2978]MCZ2849930.1 glycosyltransferase [Modestobacter sp. VKM Ac-2978]